MLDNIKWREKFGFECFGNKIGFQTDLENLKADYKKFLPENSKEIPFSETTEIVSIITKNNDTKGMYLNGEFVQHITNFDETVWEPLADKILFILAILSLPEKFFVHAGAVSFKGCNIIFPADTFKGKTTLIKDFISAGAEYITDDCVVLSDKAEILPLPRKLAVRTVDGRQLKDAREFGAKTVTEKRNLNAIIFTEYEKEAVWNPQKLSAGQAMMKLLDNFFYKPTVAQAPAEILQALSGVLSKVKVYESKRSDTKSVIEWVRDNF